MDKIFHSTFDFFTHALPGALVVAAFYLLHGLNIQSAADLFEKTDALSWGTGITILVMGYILGLVMYPLGRALYLKLGRKKISRKINQDPNDHLPPKQQLSLPDKFALIRELSPINFKYVETWHMYCGMCHNFAVACMLIAIMLLLKIDLSQLFQNGFWIPMAAVLVLFAAVFIDRAIIFSTWAANDLNATIRKLNLAEQAKNLSEKVKE